MSVEGETLSSGRSVFIIVVLLLGALIGEILNIEGWFERLGEWLKKVSGSEKDTRFVDSFLTASFIVSIGAMAVIGPINDVFYGDYSILIAKGILDLIIVMVMTAASGKGALFSFVSVGIIQGLMTVLAAFIQPLMTEAALANLSLIGSILIFCVAVNLIWDKRIRVANLLPALIIAVAAAFLPFEL